ncbi:hypothetical protein STSP2_02628 [Anaerohalosphaera lusitana]|uniref:YbaK/aminoacyl-tRNA synthetase-associated domain-containing protein n=1 Tax=Anaerohalosphaera lusitana TaxID=1936003 RepID=A0A1U9NNZ0_9BACT|nr:YbaK/EbsC family protein [Anaerohalosphaera lusitana]AQT69438.1 hypothetical protein STSP2_02628 [Anaerohalosphaera lusitana]
MNCVEFLENAGAHFSRSERISAFTSQQAVAEKCQIAGIAKAVAQALRIDDEIFLFVYPEDHAIDMDSVRDEFGAESVHRVNQQELLSLEHIKSSSLTPLGSMYGLLTFVDRKIGMQDYLVFSDPETGVDLCMELPEYRRLTHPRMFSFAYSTR